MSDVTLAELAPIVAGQVAGEGSVAVTDVVHDSRQAGPGALFVAIRGREADGHDFAPEAVSRGATALCVDNLTGLAVPQLLVTDTRAALAPLAAAVHGHPSRQLAVAAVTGTNGKTMVTHMLAAIAGAAGLRAGVVGTVGVYIGDRHLTQARTTPEASDLQRLLRRMVGEGVGVVAVEASSHALALGRVDATEFRVAGFTNLSQDHLDFHGDMESYYGAKRALFTPAKARTAVVCVDDEWGRRLAAEAEIPVTTVTTMGAADIQAQAVEPGLEQCRFTLAGIGDPVPIVLPVGGDFNVANALVAAAMAVDLGIGAPAIRDGLGKMAPVPGRFEAVSGGQDFSVIVDYAHTPDGVTAVIAAARRLTPGRVLVVVGAGGDRDRSKRPLMGAAAGAADVAIITSDNPRSEDPAAIVAEVMAGTSGSAATVVAETDRRAAIRRAVRQADAGDAVLVLGKGHEQGQEIGGRVIPFDDRLVAAAELEAR